MQSPNHPSQNSIEISISNQKYVLSGEESEAHLEEVAEMVRRKVEALRKHNPNLSLQKAAMLAAFDLASQLIKGTKRASEYRSEVLGRASEILQKVEAEQSSAPSFPVS